jgi:hypothetical protein
VLLTKCRCRSTRSKARAPPVPRACAQDFESPWACDATALNAVAATRRQLHSNLVVVLARRPAPIGGRWFGQDGRARCGLAGETKVTVAWPVAEHASRTVQPPSRLPTTSICHLPFAVSVALCPSPHHRVYVGVPGGLSSVAHPPAAFWPAPPSDPRHPYMYAAGLLYGPRIEPLAEHNLGTRCLAGYNPLPIILTQPYNHASIPFATSLV